MAQSNGGIEPKYALTSAILNEKLSDLFLKRPLVFRTKPSSSNAIKAFE